MASTAWRRIVALPTQQLAHVRPVLLLDVGVVVFLVGPPAGELDWPLGAPADQMPVDELRAIVGIDAQQAKGQGLSNLLQRLHHPVLPPPNTARVSVQPV